MGLIKAALGAAGGVMGDQWKEYFYCEALPENVLAVKGRKKVSGRSSTDSARITSFPTVPSSLWRTASACSSLSRAK